jgi:hypothetical protein
MRAAKHLNGALMSDKLSTKLTELDIRGNNLTDEVLYIYAMPLIHCDNCSNLTKFNSWSVLYIILF